MLQRSVCVPLAIRAQFHFEWKALEDFELFRQFVDKGFKQAGCYQSTASKGRVRYMNQIVTKSLQIATEKNVNHLPDEIVQESIRQVQQLQTATGR